MPKISVILPVLNEEKYIEQALEGLKHQSFKDFEVIVVDGGSKDKTVAIAKRYKARVIIDKRKGISIARNRGAWAAKGQILVFIDGDTRPSRNFLKSWSKAFEEDIVAATGPILPLEKTSKAIELGFKFTSIWYVKFGIATGSPTIIGSNFAVRKRYFAKIKGFDEKLITYEDWDLSNRLKKLGKIVFVDDAVVHTSARRVEAWGIHGYFAYHVGNMIRYTLFKKPKEEYAAIR